MAHQAQYPAPYSVQADVSRKPLHTQGLWTWKFHLVIMAMGLPLICGQSFEASKDSSHHFIPWWQIPSVNYVQWNTCRIILIASAVGLGNIFPSPKDFPQSSVTVDSTHVRTCLLQQCFSNGVLGPNRPDTSQFQVGACSFQYVFYF